MRAFQKTSVFADENDESDLDPPDTDEENASSSDDEPEPSIIQEFSLNSHIVFQFASNALQKVVFSGQFSHTPVFRALAHTTEHLNTMITKYSDMNQPDEKVDDAMVDLETNMRDKFGVVWEQILGVIPLMANKPPEKEEHFSHDVGTFAALAMTFLAASLRAQTTREYMRKKTLIIDKMINDVFVLSA